MVRYRRVATRTWVRHIDNYVSDDQEYTVTPKLRLTGFNDEEHPPHEGGTSWIHHTTTKTAI